MNKLTACLMSDLPESVMTRKRARTCYGYTIWKQDVEESVAAGAEEVERFKREFPQRLHVVTEELESHQRLLAFMTEHGLDVIFRDLESEDE